MLMDSVVLWVRNLERAGAAGMVYLCYTVGPQGVMMT